MDYTEFKDEDIRGNIVNEIRDMEAQHSRRSRDVVKFEGLIAELKNGAFEGLDKRILTSREEQWKIERDNAKSDLVTAVIVLKTLRFALSAHDAKAPAAEPVIGE